MALQQFADYPQAVEGWLVPVGPPLTKEQRAANRKVSYRADDPLSLRMSWVPWVVDAKTTSVGCKTACVDGELRDQLLLVVSQDNSCRYCHGVARALLQIQGYSRERILALESQLTQAELPRSNRVALEYARRLSRSNPRPGAREVQDLLDAGHSELSAREVAVFAAMNVFHNLTATLLGAAPDELEEMPRKWYAPVLTPFVAMILRKRGRPVGPQPFRIEHGDGPHGTVLAALAGLPAANTLGEIVNSMWTSTVLPRRTKAMLFGVVARSLQCARSEREAASLMRSDGLDDEQIGEILTTLNAPVLSDLEKVLVPFARETVRFRVEAMHRRSHEVLGSLEPAHAVEAIGVLGLANAITRLSVLSDVC